MKNRWTIIFLLHIDVVLKTFLDSILLYYVDENEDMEKKTNP
jgi:hypothetical protein